MFLTNLSCFYFRLVDLTKIKINYHVICSPLIGLPSDTIMVYICVYDSKDVPRSNTTTVNVPATAHIDDIQLAAKHMFGTQLLRNVDADSIDIYQLDKQHESKLGMHVVVHRWATRLNKWSGEITPKSHLACVVWGTLTLLVFFDSLSLGKNNSLSPSADGHNG